MKKILFALSLFLVLGATAQVKDPKATALLDEVSAKIKSYKSIRVEFSYTMVNKQAKINESKSVTIILSGDKYRLNAAGQTVICDGKTIWTYIKESNEVQINSPDNKDDAMTPSKLLTSYNKNYKSKIIKDKNQSDPNMETIELIPNVIKTINRAILIVDKTKNQVKSFQLFDKSGNVFTYTIQKFLTDIPVSNSDFTFETAKFPGVEVIDMR